MTLDQFNAWLAEVVVLTLSPSPRPLTQCEAEAAIDRMFYELLKEPGVPKMWELPNGPRWQ